AIMKQIQRFIRDTEAIPLPRKDTKDTDAQANLTSARPEQLPNIRPPVRGVLVRQKKPQADEDPVKQLLDATAKELIRTGFRDPNVQARRASYEALETLDDLAKPYIAQIVRGLSDSDLFVRWIAARTLMRLADLTTDADSALAVPA